MGRVNPPGQKILKRPTLYNGDPWVMDNFQIVVIKFENLELGFLF